MKNLWPQDPAERALAKRIVEARTPRVLDPKFKKLHTARSRSGAPVCDPLTGYCSALSAAFFHATGGYEGPYLMFLIPKEYFGGKTTHWFLVDRRNLPRGTAIGDATRAFHALAHPQGAVVDLTATQFDGPVPYWGGRRASLRQADGGDTEPTGNALIILARAGLV